MTQDGFIVLLFVSPALEVLAEIKRMILQCLLLLHLLVRALTQLHLK